MLLQVSLAVGVGGNGQASIAIENLGRNSTGECGGWGVSAPDPHKACV